MLVDELVAWWLSPVGAGLIGLCVGSFLNVVVYRLPRMMERQWWMDVAQQMGDVASWRKTTGQSEPKGLAPLAAELDRQLQALPPLTLSKPASTCPSCGHAIRWHENLPLLGWLRLRGRCSACGNGISMRYPLVELTTGALFAAASWRFEALPVTALWWGVLAVLVALTLIDWDTTLLPDALTLPLLWAGLVCAALGWTLPLGSAVGGAVVGYLSLWSVFWLFKLATGKEGMGHGDFKLLAALGAWLGWKAILPVVLMASIIGAVAGLVMKATGALREGRFVPFGPFLGGAGTVLILAGTERVLRWIGQ